MPLVSRISPGSNVFRNDVMFLNKNISAEYIESDDFYFTDDYLKLDWELKVRNSQR